MNSGSSAPISSGGHSSSAVAMASSHQMSRGDSKSTSSPVWRTTMMCSMDGTFRCCRVRVGFHRDAAAGSPKGGVLRNQHLALGIVDAVTQRLRRERAEHDGVHRPDAGTRQHRNCQLGHHLQVDANAVALLDAVRFQHIGEAFHLPQQFAVAEKVLSADGSFPSQIIAVSPPCPAST